MKDPRLYDSISRTYRSARREDPRVAAHVHAALGPLGTATRIVNVGAGTGNYEPTGCTVVAVDPSRSMLGQRVDRPALVVEGVAEALPFPDGSFDVAMAVLTVHHWRDRHQGLAEMRRVAPRQVVFLFDPDEVAQAWAVQYWPEALDLRSEQDAPRPALVGEVLDVRDVRPVPIPIDCTDGFGAAFWGRPDRYLDPDVQQGMSWLAQLPEETVRRGTDRLRADLESGAWDEQYGHLRSLAELDVGYRIVIAGTD